MFFLRLNLVCEATVSQFYPWIQFRLICISERTVVGRNTSHSVALRVHCASVRVSTCECISERCHYLWFVYQCSSDGCLFKVHNDIHTCTQSITHSIVLLTTMRNVAKITKHTKFVLLLCFFFVVFRANHICRLWIEICAYFTKPYE